MRPLQILLILILLLALVDFTVLGKFTSGAASINMSVNVTGNVTPMPAPAAALTSGCGNNIREDPEECDGADSLACFEHCMPDCKCPPWWSNFYEQSRHSYTYSKINAFDTKTININEMDTGFQAFTFYFNKTLENVRVVIDSNISQPGTYKPNGIAYQYFRIVLENMSQADSLQFRQVLFRVPVLWTTNNNAREISLQLWDDGWKKLDISKLNQDENYTYFSAAPYNIGEFAIVGYKPVIVVKNPICGNGIVENDENSATCCADAGCPKGLSCVSNVCKEVGFCGNNICESSETPQNCPADCAKKLFSPIIQVFLVMATIILVAIMIFFGQKAFVKPGKIKKGAHVSPKRWF
jgi:PGF-pre-PGF domain-containing protein